MLPPPKPAPELHEIVKELLETGKVIDIQVQNNGVKAIVTLTSLPIGWEFLDQRSTTT